MSASHPAVATEMLRVMHVINQMGVGGAETIVVTLSTHGPRWNWHTWLASSGGALEAVAATHGAQTVRLPLVTRSVRSVARASWRVRGGIQAAAPDVVLAHNVGASVVAAAGIGLLRPGRRRPRLLTVFHGVAEADLPRASSLLRRTSAAVVAVSAAAADQLRTAGYPDARLHVVPNAAAAVATRPRGPEATAARQRLGVPVDQPVALCLARMVEQKRHDVLLDAWSRTGSGVLLLAGDGPLRADLEAAGRRSGASSRVRFLGERDDVGELLAACDVTVLASDWEGLPMAVLESLAAGRPVVATAVGGLAEAIDDRCGRLVPPRDPAALARELSAVLGDPDGLTALSLGAVEASARFSVPAMMAGYDRLLRGGPELVSGDVPAAAHAEPA